MSITGKTIENILKEYEETRLSHSHELDRKRALIDSRIPELAGIESRITSLYVKRAMSRLGSSDGTPDEVLKEQIAALSTQKEILLNNAGFSLKDLEPSYTCELCKDTGYLEDGRMCTCFKAKIIEDLYNLSHLRGILKRENFDTFDFKYYSDEPGTGPSGKSALSAAKDAYNRAKAFVENFGSSADNLYICGDTAVGKTFLTNCIAREIIEQGHSVIYLSALKFFEILADSAFGKSEDDSLSAKYIYDCDLLIIDDLGTELSNSFTQTYLFDCINDRILKEKHTIISSNYSVEKLQSVYSERVLSRIISSYGIIKLFGIDIRIKKALEEK